MAIWFGWNKSMWDNLHARFDEGEVASAKPRRGSLLYRGAKPLLNNIVKSGLLAAVCVAAMSVTAAEWFADDARPAGTGDGKSEATAFHTIQEAVDAAADGDTVTVLPGEYDEGGWVDGNGYTNRVSVKGKKLVLRSRDGKATTHIVGTHDPKGLDVGVDHYPSFGPAAVRCIRVESATGSRIEGFTIRDGAVHECPTSDNDHGTGGGVFVKGGDRKVYVVDCTISGCISSRGGGMRFGTAIRCLFEYNDVYYGNGHVARETNLYNCLIRRNATNSRTDVTFNACNLMYCTVVQNPAAQFGSGCKLANTLVYMSGTMVSTADNVAYNCIVSGSADQFVSPSANVEAVSAHQFISPATGDLHLIAGAKSVTFGDPARSLFTTVPDVDLGLDLDKQPIAAATGSVAIGCYQKAIAAAGGTWTFSDRIIVDGYNTEVGNCWATAVSPNQVLKVTMPAKSGCTPFGFECDSTSYRFPDAEDSTYLLMPPEVAQSATCSPNYAKTIVYVARNGSDEDGNGSANNPYKTIQRALDSLPDTDSDSEDNRKIIRVGRGEYTAADGTSSGGDQLNVVNVSKRHVKIVGEDRENTIIRGRAAAGVDLDRSPFGCGEGAVRCVNVDSGLCVLENLTLADGRNASYAASYYGGGFRGNSLNNAYIHRCTITNCVGNRGGAYANARASACRIVKCDGYFAAVRNGIAQSCVFEDNPVVDAEGVLGQDGYAYGCTLVRGASSGKQHYFNSRGGIAWNCVAVHGVATYATGTYDGSAFFDFSVWAGGGYAKVDPALVDEKSGDYRLLSLSPVIGQGSTANEYWKFCLPDYDGNPPLVTDGRLTPGAFQRPAAAVVVAKPANGTVSNVGTNVVEEGQQLDVEFTAGTRNMIGFDVNGEFAPGRTWSYSAPVGAAVGEGIYVAATYSPDWYVNPDATVASDENDGWTPETPKLTLKGAMADVVAGDVVHAAAGSYTNETMVQTGVNLKARVVVKPGVTLVSDEGPEKTFIIGEKDLTDTAVSEGGGCGAKAVRCVYLTDGSRLSGFTVCGGRTLGGSGDSADDSGGGIHAASFGNNSSCGIADNCIVSNNWGRSGGGARGGRFYGCKFLSNTGYTSDSGARYANFYNCFFNNNAGVTVNLYYDVQNCTFGPSGTSYVLQGPQVGALAKNCVFLFKPDQDVVATNCVFRNDSSQYYPPEEKRRGCALMSVADMKLDSAYEPLKDSPLVDAADETLMTEAKRFADARGGQRIYNGAPDLGAFEYDWRGDYAADLGDGNATVGFASPKVVETVPGESVTIGAGQLDVTLTGGSATRKNRLTVPFSVVGDGTLSVYWNGGLLGAYTKADGPQTLKFKSEVADNNFVFDYDGDDAGAVVSRLGQMVPGMMLIVR